MRGPGHPVTEDCLRLIDVEAARPFCLPPDVEIEPWTATAATDFFRAYTESFRSRPGFPGWPQERWQEFFTGHETFRPELSAVVRKGGRPIAYLLAAVDPDEGDPSETVGWIVQMGVVPGERRQGLARALLERFRERAHEAGCATLRLHVNVNNPEARALYDAFGFQFDHQRSSQPAEDDAP